MAQMTGGAPEEVATVDFATEAKFVRTFLPEGVRERWLDFLPVVKLRGKVLRRLSHAFLKDLDTRFVHDPRTMPDDVAAKAQALLSQWQAAHPRQLCHILGDAPTKDGTESDGRKMPLPLARGGISDTTGVVIIVVPDQLAYYRPEDDLNKQPYYVLFRERNAESRPT